MDTTTFLAHILPTRGIYVAAEFIVANNREVVRHSAHRRVEDLANALLEGDARGNNVYHACSSFAELLPSKMRTAANAAFVRSQWLDLDVGANKDYASAQDAIKALAAFCAAVKLPLPLAVASGRGIHAYWVFDRDLPAEKAAILMSGMHSLTNKHGFRCDASRTRDLASILRPVGSHWRKETPPRVVRVLGTPPPPIPLIQYVERVKAALVAAGVSVQPPKLGKPLVANKLAAFEKADFPPSSADRILQKCGALAYVASNQTEVEEPAWRAMLGLVKHTEEGDQRAHEWSQGHPGYSRSETQHKLDSWTAGPTTCQEFGRHLPHCAQCPINGKVSSPIHLGYDEHAPSAPVQTTVEDEPETAATPAATPEPKVLDAMMFAKKQPHELPFWPTNYRWNGAAMTRAVRTDDDVVEHVPFSNMYFYPFMRFRAEDGTSAIRLCSLTGPGQWRLFEIPTSKLADNQTLATALGAYEIFAIGAKGKQHMAEWMKDGLAALRVRGVEAITYKAFGWTDENAFVIGTEKLTAKDTQPVLLAGGVPSNYRVPFGQRGTAAAWTAGVSKLYNRPGAEMHQFVICAALAAPLIALAEDQSWHGIPIALSGKSGLGKTTICQVACSAFGAPGLFQSSANSAGATSLSLPHQVALMRHLPFILDELSDREPREVSDLLYSLANGKPRIRVKQNGQLDNNDLTWDTITFVTSNANIIGHLSTLPSLRAEATQLRVFEIELEDRMNDELFAGVDVHQIINDEITPNYGNVGRRFLREVLMRRPQVSALIRRVRSEITTNLSERATERFYYDCIAMVLVAGHVASKLGLIDFDMKRVKRWALAHVQKLREARNSCTKMPEDSAHDFVSWLHGRTVVTRYFPDQRGHSSTATEQPLEPLRWPPVARLATEDKRFFVTVAAFNQWCKENKVSPQNLRRELDAQGYFEHRGRPDPAHIQPIFKNTSIPGGRTRCYELRFDRLADVVIHPFLHVIKPSSGQPTQPTQPGGTP